MKTIQPRMIKGALCGLFSLLPLSAAIAQATQADATPAMDEEIQIEKIMVTAQKRGESLQEVPLALSVVNGKELDRGNLQTFQDLQNSVPNLSMVTTTPFATTVNMRGIPSNPNGVFNSGTSPGLGIYVDGVVYARATGFNQDLSNIAQVEVLRGPQGTLFGQNTNLGVVNITTKKPSDIAEAKVKVDVGNFGLQRINAYVTGPLVDGLVAGSLSAFNVTRDGYMTNLADGVELGDEDRHGGRAQLRITPDADLTVDINAEFMKDSSLPIGRRLTDDGYGLGYIGLLGQGTSAANFYTDDKWKTYANTERFFADRDNWGVDATVSYKFGSGFEFKSITAKKEYDAVLGMDTDGTSIDLSSSQEGEDNSQFTQEFQLISPADQAFRYVVGLYYLDNQSTNHQEFLTGTGIYGIPTGYSDPYPTSVNVSAGSGVVLDGEMQTKSSAIFTNLNYDISDDLNAFLGLRYSKVKKDMAFAQDGWETSLTSYIGYYLLNYIDIPTTHQSQDDSFVSWTTGLSYQLADNVNVYAKVAKGFKEGGYSFRPQSLAAIGGDVTNPDMDFGREEVMSYELGLKSDLLNRRMRLNLAMFYLDYEDIQTRVVDDNGVNRVVNGPTATSQGVEAEIRYLFTKEFSVSATIGYADATFGDFANCHTTDDCTGNQLPGAAKWTNTLAAKYESEINDNWEIFAGVDYSYRSEIQSDARNLTATELDASNLVNGQIGLVSSDGTWEFMLWGKNLTDDEYLVSVDDKATSDLSFTRELYGTPRTFGLSVTYNYF